MGKEIERKFIVDLSKFTRDIDLFPNEEILQGYLPDKNGLERRIRKKGVNYVFTKKDKGNLKRFESPDKAISKKRFDSLISMTNGEKVEKTRYYVPFSTIGKMIELDVYHGPLEGLITAEIEFESVNEARLFMPVHWFVKEVTNDRRYKNRNLARDGVPKDFKN